MENNTGPHLERVGTPLKDITCVPDWVEVVDLDGKAPHECLNVTSSNEPHSGWHGVPVQG